MNRRCIVGLLVPLLIPSLIDSATAQGKIFGGLSIPVGEFASTDSATGGFAGIGFAAGAEIVGKFYFGSEIGFSGVIDYHLIDERGFLKAQPDMPAGQLSQVSGWVHIWPMASLGYTIRSIPSVPIYVRAHGGVLFGVSPGMTVDHFGTKFTQNPAFKISFAWGAEVGACGFDKYTLGIRFMTSKPEYDINRVGGGTTLDKRSRYVTNVLQVLLGMVL